MRGGVTMSRRSPLWLIALSALCLQPAGTLSPLPKKVSPTRGGKALESGGQQQQQRVYESTAAIRAVDGDASPVSASSDEDEAEVVGGELYVGNLRYDMTAEELRVAFDAVRAHLPSADKQGRGFGFVILRPGADATAVAQSMNGKRLGGRDAVVRLRRVYKKRSRPVSAAVQLNKQLTSARTTRGLLLLLGEDFSEWSPVNLATALHRLGKLSSGSSNATYDEEACHRLVEATARSMLAKPGKWGTREAANACWGAARSITSRRRNKESEILLMKGLDALTASSMANFSAQSLSNTAWAIAKLGHSCDSSKRIAEESAARIGEFSGQGVSNLAWAFATLGGDIQLFEAISAEALQRLDEFRSQELANLVWSFAKRRHYSPELFAAVARRIDDEEMSPRSLATTAWAFARVSRDHSTSVDEMLFARLANSALSQMDGFSAQGLSNLAWAMASSSVNEGFFEELAEHAVARLGEFKPEELSSLAVAYSRASIQAPALYEAIAGRVVADPASFRDPRLIPNLAWAFAKQKEGNSEFYRVLSLNCFAKIDEFTPQGISNVLWAVSTSASEDAYLLYEPLARQALVKMAGFGPQALANTAWALAKMGKEADWLGPVFRAIAVESRAKMGEFKPQEVANLVWAFATVEIFDDEELIETLALRARATIAEFEPRALSMTAWSLARLESTSGFRLRHSEAQFELFESIAVASRKSSALFGPQEISTTAWAYARTGHRAPSLFASLQHAARREMATFNPQSLANTAWAFAHAGVVAPELFAAMGERASTLLPEFSAQGLANLASAFAKVGCLETSPALLLAIADDLLDDDNQIIARDDLTTQSLANVAWALSSVSSEVTPSLTVAIAGECLERIAAFSAADLATLAAALAAKQPPEEQHFLLIRAVASQLLLVGKLEDQLKPPVLSQLYRSTLALKCSDKECTTLTEQLEAKIRDSLFFASVATVDDNQDDSRKRRRPSNTLSVLQQVNGVTSSSALWYDAAQVPSYDDAAAQEAPSQDEWDARPQETSISRRPAVQGARHSRC